MSSLIGKIVEAQAAGEGSSSVGVELKKLRQLAGFTQGQISHRMGVQQAAVSKIEAGGEVYLSTVRRYVEALGASLRLSAEFPTNSPVSARLREVFDVEQNDDNQLVLPLLDDDEFKPQRDIVLSIKPVYTDKILEGKKKVELRRRFPVSAPNGSIAYIYSTSPIKAMVGTAAIRRVLKLPIDQIWEKYESTAFINKALFDKYFEGLDYGFALEFEDVRSFSRPLPLSELRDRFGFEPPQSYLYAKHDLRRALKNEPSVVSH